MEFDRKPDTPEGVEGPMAKEMKSRGSMVPVPVISAFAEMSSDVEAHADVTASALAAGHKAYADASQLRCRAATRPLAAAVRSVSDEK